MDWPRPRTALLVDGSAIVRERIVQLMETIPNLAVVGQCEDSECALGSIIRLTPDIVLLDIRLRGGGMKVLSHTAEHYPGTTIVVLTNQADDRTRRICLTRGAHYFLDKSKDFDRLAELMGSLVRRRSGF